MLVSRMYQHAVCLYVMRTRALYVMRTRAIVCHAYTCDACGKSIFLWPAVSILHSFTHKYLSTSLCDAIVLDRNKIFVFCKQEGRAPSHTIHIDLGNKASNLNVRLVFREKNDFRSAYDWMDGLVV